MDKEPELTFLQTKTQKHQHACKKMLNITNCWKNANQNLRYHLISIRIAAMKKKKPKNREKISSISEVVEKLKTLGTQWECKMVQLLWKIVQPFLKKLKIEVPYDPPIPLLSRYTKELKAGSQRDTCNPCSSSVIDNSQRWKQSGCHPQMNG